MYTPPDITAGPGAARRLHDLAGPVIAVTMEIPWKLLQKSIPWQPAQLQFITNMDLATLQNLHQSLPPCAAIVGVGGGSAMDTAKYLAWQRNCPVILVPTILSVDAPFTNTIAVRIEGTVQYIGDIYPREVIIDHQLIQLAPRILNQAGACDIASIHTALHDWTLAHQHNGEPHDPQIAQQARQCLAELDQNAAEIHGVTQKGIDTLVQLFQREVELCARFGSSRPEEGSEHLLAYNVEHITRRHFIHGDLVGFGIVAMARLQQNDPEGITELVQRIGLRYTVPDANREELRESLLTLKKFKDANRLFFSVVDCAPISEAFVEETLAAL